MNPELKDYPCNLEMEYALIGAVLLRNELMAKVADLSPGDFYSLQHADIWQAIEQLYRKGENISPFTILPLLQKPEIMENPLRYIGLAIAASNSILPSFITEHVKYLVELSQRRELASTCSMLSQSSLDASEMASHMSKSAEKVIFARPVDDFEDNYQVTDRILSNLKDPRKPHSTGIAPLDEAMGGGLYAGKSYGFAARKKIGKTMLAGTISHNLNMAGVKHCFICGEMSPDEIQERILARMVGFFPSAFKSGFGKTENFETRIAECARAMPRNMIFKNAPGLTFDDLKTIYTAAIDYHGVKGIILDYWQLVGGKPKHQSEAAHYDDVAQWVADYSRKRGIWTIMMAQVNQEGNTRGGEGIRLAFDQVYNLKAPEDDPSRSGRYLEMMETRYTPWRNIGTDITPKLHLNEKGLFFEVN